MLDTTLIAQLVKRVPMGYTQVSYQGRTYGLSATPFNEGLSLKVFAEELGGEDFISFNYYQTQAKNYLKPCEMPEEKVLNFLRHWKPVNR